MSHSKAILIALAGVLLAFAPSVRADSLQLKNGNFVQGKYLGGTERAVQFVVNGKIRLYDIEEILSISFGSASSDNGGIPSNTATRKSGPDIRTNSLAATDSRWTPRGTRLKAPMAGTREISWSPNPYSSHGIWPFNNAASATAVCRQLKHSLEIKAGISAADVPIRFMRSAEIRD